MNLVTGAGIIERVATRKDGTLSITIGTQEATPELGGRLFTLNNQFIKFLFTDGAISTEAKELIEDIELTAPKPAKFSKGQILRFAIKDLYKCDNRGFKTDEEFYEAYMQGLIEKVNLKVAQYQ